MQPAHNTRKRKIPVVFLPGQQSERQRTVRSALIASNSQVTNVAATHQPYSNSDSPSSSNFNNPRIRPVTSEYRFLGHCDQVCEYCGALFWYAERLTSSRVSSHPRYSVCCKRGKVRLPLSDVPPPTLKLLFENSVFQNNIRAYNSMFSMTSFGAHIDESINQRSGPYVFKVEGQISHWIGSFCPPSNTPPRFLQMYIYDTQNEVNNRMRFFDNSLSAAIVQNLIDVLDNCNNLVKLMRTARDLCAQTDIPDFSIRLYHRHRQVSNDIPAPGTIGAIIRDTGPLDADFDIIIRGKDTPPKRISKLHPLYMPLQYPLLFPYAEAGWSPELRLQSNDSSRNRQLTMNMFYTFHVHDRAGRYSFLLNGGRLFQQYLVDAYICIEQNRLEYIQANQNLFRSESLRGIHDAISQGDTDCKSIGKRVILPSSFTGGPRYMYKHYQDALAICRVHGNPQYFITFTCNVNWPEIKQYTSPNSCHLQPGQERPDVIARVFQLKVKDFINFLKKHKLFGEVAAELYTIEFQKRGLPHCHLLLWVTAAHKIQNAEEVDKFISAELPDKHLDSELYRIVTESLLHGPCGIPWPTSPCMRDGVCSKHFPKQYENTTRFDKNGYIYYKRSPNAEPFMKNNIPLDNGYVTPYNKTLCMCFDAHINVEYCGWSMLIKYLFKYISKGVDRIKFAVSKASRTQQTDTNKESEIINEIKNFVDGRYICPHEAAWRIFDFPIHHRNPAVQVLAVHLENLQNVTFRDTERLQNVISNPTSKKTTLTEWLRNNYNDPSGRHLRYVDYLSEYRWEPSGRGWIRRLSNKEPSIGRLAYVHPASGDIFYMRMLLQHQVGCTSFTSINTVSGVVYPTCRAACERLGLIGDDKEWDLTFTEASTWASATELRLLFAHMLLFCSISNPCQLWTKHWLAMTDDLSRNISHTLGISAAITNTEDLQHLVLYELELLLKSSSRSTSLSDYGLPLPSVTLLASLKNRLLLEEKNYDRQSLATTHATMLEHLNAEQLLIYTLVMNSLASTNQLLLFIYGHGGTGKTYLWTTIISAVRSNGQIVLAVAGSGVASLLLPLGRTAHSRFKIPLDLNDESLCYIKKNTQLAQLLTETSLIIWDETPMTDKRCFESLDRSLRDLLDNPNIPFGGKSILLGGDFRQTLPVKRKCSKSEIIDSSLPTSSL